MDKVDVEAKLITIDKWMEHQERELQKHKQWVLIYEVQQDMLKDYKDVLELRLKELEQWKD